MSAEQLPYWLALNCIQRLSVRKLHLLLDYFQQDPVAVWQSWEAWRPALEPISDGQYRDVLAQRKQVDPAALYETYLSAGCGLCVWGDPEYPPLLAQIYDPPLVLFYHGTLPGPEEICVAMIGSRDFSPYGRQVAEIFSRDLSEQGITVVSGLARGVDSVCHRGALAGGGRTIAVLGSGLDVIYPRENQDLYQQICGQGAVLSEFPLGTPPLPAHFPRRNRIISGLCQGILVVEAGEKSGTMLTVNYALEQGRDVFAVPGPVTSPTSRGTNRLIRDGARMALSAEDIRSAYCPDPPKPVRRQKEPKPAVSPTERTLLEKLLLPVQMDELALDPELGLEVADLSAILTMLEIRGLVRQLPGKYYQAVVKNIHR